MTANLSSFLGVESIGVHLLICALHSFDERTRERLHPSCVRYKFIRRDHYQARNAFKVTFVDRQKGKFIFQACRGNENVFDANVLISSDQFCMKLSRSSGHPFIEPQYIQSP